MDGVKENIHASIGLKLWILWGFIQELFVSLRHEIRKNCLQSNWSNYHPQHKLRWKQVAENFYFFKNKEYLWLKTKKPICSQINCNFTQKPDTRHMSRWSKDCEVFFLEQHSVTTLPLSPTESSRLWVGGVGLLTGLWVVSSPYFPSPCPWLEPLNENKTELLQHVC